MKKEGRKTRIGVLASGRGSNLQAIIDSTESGELKGLADVSIVVSDRQDAYALERARKHNIFPVFIDPKKFKDKNEYDGEIVKTLRGHGVELVLLAGYMRIIGVKFIQEFRGRIMNIHPALLPSFPGLHAQKQALDYGVKVSGCTVHFVDEEVDHGPIIIQAAVPILEGDDDESLSKRILEQEHKIYSRAVRLYAEGKLRIEGRKVRVLE